MSISTVLMTPCEQRSILYVLGPLNLVSPYAAACSSISLKEIYRFSLTLFESIDSHNKLLLANMIERVHLVLLP